MSDTLLLLTSVLAHSTHARAMDESTSRNKQIGIPAVAQLVMSYSIILP